MSKSLASIQPIIILLYLYHAIIFIDYRKCTVFDNSYQYHYYRGNAGCIRYTGTSVVTGRSYIEPAGIIKMSKRKKRKPLPIGKRITGHGKLKKKTMSKQKQCKVCKKLIPVAEYWQRKGYCVDCAMARAAKIAFENMNAEDSLVER